LIAVLWHGRARRDLDTLFDYLLQHDPRAALGALARIRHRVGQLADHPQLGRPGRVAGTRELVVTGTSYIVAYRVTSTTIDILAVIHASRRWPNEIDG
jgi:toxin ParE1/3/4